MKHRKFVVWAGAFVCLAALLLGCPTEPDDDDDVPVVETLAAVEVKAGETKYFSLTTGERIPDDQKNTTNWDIAFTRTRLILTNSGVTASTLSSSGQAKVWYAGTDDFSSVTIDNKGEDDAFLSTDTGLYVWTGMGGAPNNTSTLNVMTYVGYEHGDGSTNSFGNWQPGNPMQGEPHNYTDYPENGPLTVYEYNADQYYNSGGSMEGGGPTFSPNGKVYIIKHANSNTYSKIQIVYEFDGDTPADVYQVTHEILDNE
jgi:hypothetical protein